MEKWLGCALDYIPRWIEFQAPMLRQPGCIVMIAHRDKVMLEQAFGSANLATGEALTPRHRFRIGSQSKSRRLPGGIGGAGPLHGNIRAAMRRHLETQNWFVHLDSDQAVPPNRQKGE